MECNMELKITKQFLKKKNACSEGYEWYLEQKTTDANEIFKRLIKEERLLDLNWIVTKMMNKEQCVKYAIYAAEQVLYLFEKEFPDDKRPRKAILAAKRYLKNPTEKNARAADVAAWAARAAGAAAWAAGDAGDAWAARAAWAAGDAGDAAWAAAWAAVRAAVRDAAGSAMDAAWAARDAARDAAWAARDAAWAAWDAKYNKMLLKICEYGIKLLKTL